VRDLNDLENTQLMRSFLRDQVNSLARGLVIGGCALLLWTGLAQAQTFLNVNKSFAPINVAVGKTSSLVITFSNTSGDTSATAVAGTDTLPAGLALISVGASTCGFNTAASALLSVGATLSWANGVVPPNATCTLTAVVSPYQAGTWINTIPTAAVSGFIGAETVSGFSTASATITSNGVFSGMSIAKTANGTVLRGDGTRSYTISLTNQNASPLTGVAFTDTLPVKLRMAVPGGVILNTCGGSTQNTLGGTIADGDLGLRLVGGALAASASCSVTFVVRTINNTSLEPNATVINNLALVTTNEGIPNANNASVAIAVESGVNTSKFFTPNSIPAGGTSMLYISLANHNVNSISNIGLTDTMPAGLTIQSYAGVQGFGCSTTPTVVVTASQFSFSNLTLYGQNPNFGGVSSCWLGLIVTAPAVGTYDNTIPAGTFTGGFPYFGAAASLAVINPVSGGKAFAPTTLVQGGTALLTITLNNAAAVAATNASFTDSLATMGAGVSVAASPAPTNTCGGALTAVAGASTLSLVGGTIAPNSSCQVTLPVLVAVTAITGTRINTIPAGSVTSSLGSNASAFSANLRILADIDVSKNFSANSTGGVVPQTGSTLLTISLFNATGGPNAAITSFVDDLTTMGPGITIGATPVPTNNCGGTLSAVAGSTTIALQGGTIVSGGSCQLVVPVVVGATQNDSNRLNTIFAGALVTDQGSNTNAIAAGFRIINAMGISKAYSPPIIGPAQVSRLSVTITHAVGAVAFTGMGFTDALPIGHTVANPPNVVNTCGGAVAAISGASSFTLSGAGLPTGATSCALALDIQSPTGTGSVANTIPFGSVTTNELVYNWMQALDTLQRRIGSPAAINKSFTPANIYSGSSSVLQVVISNPNPYPLTSVTLADVMPAGMSVFGVPDASTSCGAGVVTALSGGNTLSLRSGTVPALGSCFFQANVTSIIAGNVVNTIPSGALSNVQSVTNNNTSSASLQVLNDLSISKVFIPTLAQAGLTSTLIVTVGNSLTSTMVGLNPNAFTDVLPPGLEIASNVATTSCGGSVSSNTGAPLAVGAVGFRLNGGSFATGTQCTVSVVVRTATPGATGLYVNTIPVSSVNTVLGPTNIFPAVATVTFVANPLIYKVFSPASVKVGVISYLRISVSNPNPYTLIPGGLTNVSFTDTLPAGMSIFASGAAGGACPGTAANIFSAGQTVLSFTGLLVPGNGSCEVTVAVIATNGGVYVNTITGVVSKETPVPTTQIGSATLTVLAPPSISKFFSPSLVLSGGTGTTVLTIVIDNPNPTTPLNLDSVPGIGVLDVFPTSPGQMVVAAVPALTNCVTGVIRSTAGDFLAVGNTGLQMFGGIVPANGSCTIVVTVQMPVAGSYLNTSGPVNSTNAGSSVNGATATVQNILAANITLTKDNGASTVVAGASVNYTITVANLGPANASGTVVRDAPSAGLSCTTLSCSATGGASCPVLNLPLFLGTGLTLSALPGGGQVVFTLGCTVTATGLP
jgi:uncharacterized repeat protein (TIGR01451 family)